MTAAPMKWNNVSEVFRMLDVDGSAGIDMDELEKAVVAQGYSIEVAKLLMSELDTNGDGVISYAELKANLAKSSFAPAKQPPRTELRQLSLVLGYFVVGALVYGVFEGWSALDSAYFLMVTCTTVGYGDFAPTTQAGKLFTCGYALLGMTLVISSLAPVVDLLSDGIAQIESALTGFLERHQFIRPAVNTLDMNLTVAEVNATINYTRRYLVALNNLFVFLIAGLVISQYVIDSGDWVDSLYWTIISMTTCANASLTPAIPAHVGRASTRGNARQREATCRARTTLLAHGRIARICHAGSVTATIPHRPCWARC